MFRFVQIWLSTQQSRRIIVIFVLIVLINPSLFPFGYLAQLLGLIRSQKADTVRLNSDSVLVGITQYKTVPNNVCLNFAEKDPTFNLQIFSVYLCKYSKLILSSQEVARKMFNFCPFFNLVPSQRKPLNLYVYLGWTVPVLWLHKAARLVYYHLVVIH